MPLLAPVAAPVMVRKRPTLLVDMPVKPVTVMSSRVFDEKVAAAPVLPVEVGAPHLSFAGLPVESMVEPSADLR